MKPARPTPSQQLAVLMACELTLVRCSSGPVSVVDSAFSFIVLLLLATLCDRIGKSGHWLVGVLWGLSLFGVVLYPLYSVSESVMFWALLTLPILTTVLWLRMRAWVQRYSVIPITYGTVAVVSWWVDDVLGFGLILLVAVLLMSLISRAIFHLKKSTWRLVLIIYSVCVALVLPDFSSSTISENRSEQPDILLVTVDTLRAKSAHEMTSFTQVGEQGCRFTHALAPAPWTLPSMATIHTGELPAVHKAKGTAATGFQAMHADVPTLAENLRDAGYQTTSVVAANPFVGESFGFSRGFDRSYHGRDGRNLGLPRGRHKGSLGRLNLARLATSWSLVPEPGYDDAGVLVTRAIQEIAKADNRPMFLWVHLLDVHLPYTHAMQIDAPWMTRVGLSKLNRRGLLSNAQWRGELGRKQLENGYENEVRVVDGALVDLLAAYRKRGASNITVMTADHGEEIREHGGLEHGHTLHAELLHVPLVISGITTCDAVERIPTSLSVIKPLLLGALEEEAEKPRPHAMLAGFAHESGDLLYPSKNGHTSSLLWDDWKLIQTNNVPILYNWVLDAKERVDVAATHPEIVAKMGGLLSHEKTEMESVGLTAEERGMLEVLGYLENQTPNK